MLKSINQKEKSSVMNKRISQFFTMVVPLGESGLHFFEHIFGVTSLFFQALYELRKIWFYRRQVVEQCYSVGVGSIGLILVVSAFTGMVTAVQAAYQMEPYYPKYTVGALILQSVVLELGPVLTALVLAGRVGAGTAAEIGTMKVSEQVDALESLALNPVGYLAMPRLIAGFVMIPALTIISDTVAVIAGYTVAINTIDMTTLEFVKGMKMYFHLHDVIVGMMKAFCFGGMITLIGTYMGLTAKNGAKGVGTATTLSVVTSAVLILILDYVVAQVFL